MYGTYEKSKILFWFRLRKASWALASAKAKIDFLVTFFTPVSSLRTLSQGRIKVLSETLVSVAKSLSTFYHSLFPEASPMHLMMPGVMVEEASAVEAMESILAMPQSNPQEALARAAEGLLLDEEDVNQQDSL